MFGVYGQGKEDKGYKSENSGVCGDRRMIVTVTANEDMTSDEVILLEVGSYSFYEDSSVIKTGLTLATLATSYLYLF